MLVLWASLALTLALVVGALWKVALPPLSQKASSFHKRKEGCLDEIKSEQNKKQAQEKKLEAVEREWRVWRREYLKHLSPSHQEEMQLQPLQVKALLSARLLQLLEEKIAHTRRAPREKDLERLDKLID